MLSTCPFLRHPVLFFSSLDFLFFSWTPQSDLPAPRPGPFHQTGNHTVSPSQNAFYIESDPFQKAHKGPVFDPFLFFHTPVHGIHFQARKQTLSPRARPGVNVCNSARGHGQAWRGENASLIGAFLSSPGGRKFITDRGQCLPRNRVIALCCEILLTMGVNFPMLTTLLACPASQKLNTQDENLLCQATRNRATMVRRGRTGSDSRPHGHENRGCFAGQA